MDNKTRNLMFNMCSTVLLHKLPKVLIRWSESETKSLITIAAKLAIYETLSTSNDRVCSCKNRICNM